MPQAMRPVGVIEETVGVVDETVLEPSVAVVSWAPVAAGAVASCALTFGFVVVGRRAWIFRGLAVGQFRSFRNYLSDRYRTLLHCDGHDLVGRRRLPGGAVAQSLDRCRVHRSRL